MAAQKIVHLSVEQRRARGREARDRTPPDSHSGWAPAADRPDPVGLLKDQDATPRALPAWVADQVPQKQRRRLSA